MSGPIAVVLPSPSSIGFPLQKDASRKSYQRLSELADTMHIDIRFVLGEQHYKNGKFSAYWKYEGSNFVEYCTTWEAALVYLQTRHHGMTFPKQVNNSFLEECCVDKYKTAQVFKDFSKKTLLVSPTCLINTLATDLIVIKPQFGSQGERVEVLKKDAYNFEKYVGHRFIAQEFIDSSAGIAPFVARRHELRLYVLNGKIACAYLRIPAKNSYLSNISQGATEQQMNLSDVPTSAVQLANSVDSIFTTITPRLYVIDVMYEDGRPWIVELNDMPGMPDIEIQPFTNTYFHAMLSLFEQSM